MVSKADRFSDDRLRLGGADVRSPAEDGIHGAGAGPMPGLTPMLQLPVDRPRPPRRTSAGDRRRAVIGPRQVAEIESLARVRGVTRPQVMFAAFGVLLYRYTGQTDLAIGVPSAGGWPASSIAADQPARLVPVRANLSGDPTFEQILERMPGMLAAAGDMASDSDGHAPVQVVFHDVAGESTAWPAGVAPGRDGFDLMLTLQRRHEDLLAEMAYDAEIFEPDRIERMLEHYQVLLHAVVADPDRPVGGLPLLTEAQKRQILVEWNQAGPWREAQAPLHVLFERQAQRTPDSVAVVFGDEHLTYGQLNGQANQLARHLDGRGIGPGDLVGVCLDRSLDLAVAWLGVLKAGAAYVPLDPCHPKPRLAYIVEDSQVAAILTRGPIAALSDIPAPVIDLAVESSRIARHDQRNPDVAVTVDAPAYVIYTSGSTGAPKGVVMAHAPVCKLMAWVHEAFAITGGDQYLQVCPVHFDPSVWEFFTPLLAGATAVMLPAEVRHSAAAIIELIQRRGITHIHAGPALLQLLVEEPGFGACESLRCILSGGEPLQVELSRRVLSRVSAALYNVYGPTEACIASSWWRCLADESRLSVPIGRPMGNTRLYILNAHDQPQPVGVPGELCIGGDRLAVGYLNRADLTRQRFVPDPFDDAPGARMYRTGDVCRWLPDGSVEFLGRADDQVKIRGFRVELGEIDAVLSQHAQVRECVTVVGEAANDRCLVAYLACRDGQRPGIEQIRAYLGERLPDHMVPAVFVVVDQIPRLPNGKVNRAALPEPSGQRPALDRPYAAPRTDTQRVLADLWSECLGVRTIGIHDNFFDLGGHSLRAAVLMSRIDRHWHCTLPLRCVFETPTVAGLAGVIDTALSARGASAGADNIKPIPRDRPLVLSSAQERLWFLDQVEKDSPLYNVAWAIRLEGALNVRVLRKSLAAVVERHEILRTTFTEMDGQPVQMIDPRARVPLEVVDFDEGSPQEREQRLWLHVRRESRRPFDLTFGPLARMQLLRLGDTDHVLFMNMHHIICDEWSHRLFMEELSALYEAGGDVKTADVPELPIQYADYAAWQHQRLSNGKLEREFDYWRRQLAGAPASLPLPGDRPWSSVRSFQGGTHDFEIAPRIADRMRALSRERDVTLFMSMLAAFEVLLYRYSGQTDVVVGTPITNRNRAEVEPLIGFFLNTLALRIQLDGGASFDELLQRVRATALEAYAHDEAPFEQLVARLAPERHHGRTPLLHAVFVLLNEPDAQPRLGVATAQTMVLDTGTAKFPLMLTLVGRADGGMKAQFEYNSDLFDASTIERMGQHFVTLVDAIAAGSHRPIDELNLLPEAERARLLVEFNDTAVAYPQDRCIHELFEVQAQQRPDATAVIDGGVTLTYRQLNEKANQTAWLLREQGVGRGSVVAVLMDRSADLLVALLGILKAGGAYVPLNSADPPRRQAFVCQDSGAAVLMTHRGMSRNLDLAGKVVDLDAEAADLATRAVTNLEPVNGPDDLAYIMYTSGSTGQPKGVMIPHRGVVRLLCGADYAPFDDQQRFLVLAPTSFDASTFEMWGPLLHGSTCVVHGDAALQLDGLERVIRERQVTCMWLTAQLFNTVVEQRPQALRTVSHLLVGGEALSAPTVRRALELLPETRITNGYGPTEGTTFTCTYAIPRDLPPDVASIPIGRPIANTRVYILDGRLQPVPIGVPGELYIGGAGLACGYLNRPDLTARSFVPDPFSEVSTARLYRTGDIARWRESGDIEFLGRRDDQVKLRGFRIELGEIEAVLGRHDAVGQCAVVVREVGGDKALVAYLTPGVGPPPSIPVLREYLAARLPAYMVPSAFVTMQRLPVTANGKLDRRALPDPDAHIGAGKAHVEPRTATERRLEEIWCNVLGLRQVSVTDSFFELGGHSLKAVRMFAEIDAAMGVALPVVTLFHAPTIEALAREIDHQGPAVVRDSTVVALQSGGDRPPVFLVHAIGGTALNYPELTRHLGPDQPVYGLQSVGVDGKRPTQRRIEEMAATYLRAIRQVQAQGPYHLLAFSFGCVVAFEMAQQLSGRGEEVAFLGFIDGTPPHPTEVKMPMSMSLLAARLTQTAHRVAGLFGRETTVRTAIGMRWRAWVRAVGAGIRREADQPREVVLDDILDMSAWPPHMRKIARIHFQAYLKYEPRPYTGRIDLFRSRSQLLAPQNTMGWGELAPGRVVLHDLSGTHSTIFREPHVRVLARQIAAALAQSPGPTADA